MVQRKSMLSERKGWRTRGWKAKKIQSKKVILACAETDKVLRRPEMQTDLQCNLKRYISL